MAENVAREPLLWLRKLQCFGVGILRRTILARKGRGTVEGVNAEGKRDDGIIHKN